MGIYRWCNTLPWTLGDVMRDDEEYIDKMHSDSVNGWCVKCDMPKLYIWNGNLYVCETCGAPYLKAKIEEEDTQGD